MNKSIGLSLCGLVILLTLPLFGCEPTPLPPSPTPPPLTLTTSSAPQNGGTVSPSGGTTYKKGAEVTLIATPASYYEFKGWAGEMSGTTNPVTIRMDSNKNIVATFAKKYPSLRFAVDPTGSGTIDPISGNYEAGTQVRITATPASGFRFDRWGGSATGNTNPLSVLVDGNKTITGYFIRQYSLRVSSNPIEAGTITPGTGVYDTGTKINLSAIPSFPYYLKNWTGTDNNNANPTTVTMTGDTLVTAFFIPLTTIRIKKTVTGDVYGGIQAKPEPKPRDSIPIQLYQYEWVQGEIIAATNPPVGVVIKDPTGKLVKDFGAPGQANFTFMAQIASPSPYTITFQNTSMFHGAYRLTYTVYGLPQ